MMPNTLLWVVLPYACLAVFLAGHVWRWRHDQFGWTTRTSQLLESRLLRLGSPLFHLGAFGVIAGHAIGLFVPASLTADVGIGEGLYHRTAVWGGAVTGLMLVAGLGLLIARRVVNRRVRAATTAMDRVLYLALTAMVGLGMTATVGVNILGRGYDYRETVSLWFRGVLTLNPDSGLVTGAPLVYQLHALGGFLFLALWPFTRLVHVWSAPLAYLWRPYVVYRSRAGAVPAPRPAPATVRAAVRSDSRPDPLSR